MPELAELADIIEDLNRRIERLQMTLPRGMGHWARLEGDYDLTGIGSEHRFAAIPREEEEITLFDRTRNGWARLQVRTVSWRYPEGGDDDPLALDDGEVLIPHLSLELVEFIEVRKRSQS